MVDFCSHSSGDHPLRIHLTSLRVVSDKVDPLLNSADILTTLGQHQPSSRMYVLTFDYIKLNKRLRYAEI